MDERDWAFLILACWFFVSSYWCLACAWVAGEKERSVPAWAALGFALWFAAFLPLAVAPDLTEYAD